MRTSLGVIFLLSTSLTALDLSGEWDIMHIACTPGEKTCAEELTRRRPQKLIVPQNLRKQLPHFVGELTLTRKFGFLHAQERQALVLGGVASVDSVSLNGRSIGTTGRLASGWISSFHNTARIYEFGAGYLEKENTVSVSIVVADEKAGIFRGPVVIVPAHEATALTDGNRIFYQYTLYGVLVFLFALLLFFSITLAMGLLERNYIYIILTIAGFIVHVAYFVPLPFVLPATFRLCLTFAAGWLATCFSLLFFYRLFNALPRRLEMTALCAAASVAAGHFLFTETASLIAFVRLFHGVILSLVIGTAVVFTRLIWMRPDLKAILGIIVPGAWAIVASLAFDFYVRLSYSELPVSVPYGAGLYAIMILVLHTHQMKDATDKARLLRDSLENERNRIAGEIHDVVGSELTVLMLESEDPKTDIKTLGQRLKFVLESIRDLVFLLNNKTSLAENLEGQIALYAHRLGETKKYEIHLDLKKCGILLGLEKSLHLHRIFTEWMNNTIRHAKPKKLDIRLAYASDTVSLEVQHDGAPFDWDGTPNGSGLGNIAHRAGKMKANVSSQGTRFVLHIPVGA